MDSTTQITPIEIAQSNTFEVSLEDVRTNKEWDGEGYVYSIDGFEEVQTYEKRQYTYTVTFDIGIDKYDDYVITVESVSVYGESGDDIECVGLEEIIEDNLIII